MNTTTTNNVELCPRCRASIALTSYSLPFEEESARAYHNPPKTDSSPIESSLVDPSAELTAVAQEIHRVELLLSALKTHHAHLERHIHRTTTYIQCSPIRQLPTEILAVIFALACTSFQEWEYKTPLSVSLVCTKWRDISMSMPTLWANIYVAPYSKVYGVPVFEYYLQRCGAIPLSVKVEISAGARPPLDDYDDDFPDEDGVYGFRAQRLMKPIFATFPQWKVAEFHMKQTGLRGLDDHCPNQRSPLLESLTLTMRYPEMDGLPRILREAPLLSSLTLVDPSENGGSFFMFPGFPWSQLRQIHSNRLLAVAHNQTLDDDFPDGENRTLIITSLPTQTDFVLYNSVYTVHVTSLILDGLYWDRRTSTFFNAISIPSLKELLINYAESGVRWNVQFLALAGFLARSQCTLHAFSLVDVVVDQLAGRDEIRTVSTTLADDLVDLLHAMSHLNRLQVVEAESGPPLLGERFSQELLNNTLLPELTSLELVWAEDRQPDRELLPALSSRGDGNLSSVVLGIRNGGNLGPEVLECMRDLREKKVQATCW